MLSYFLLGFVFSSLGVLLGALLGFTAGRNSVLNKLSDLLFDDYPTRPERPSEAKR